MGIMTIATKAAQQAWLPSGRSFTVDDLDKMPDDGNRYELIDGVLIVSPSPTSRHQTLVLELAVLLRAHCLDDLQVFIAPFDVRLSDDTDVQPDVMVVRRSDLTEKNLPVAPLLAVEILSPSTRSIDLHVKRERLRKAGCPSYWVIDPADGHLTGWDLDNAGQYVEVADLTAEQTWTATQPFEVTITPGDLLR